jgi:hypothetical protein
MPVVSIEPSSKHPVPYDTSDDCAPNLIERLAVAGNTAELQVALGASLEMPPEDVDKTKALLDSAVKNHKTAPLNSLPVAYGAAQFLREYGQQLALDAASTRAAITSKLMEIANCGDTKYELKALELLGKHSDIGLFTERSEVTINYKSPEALEDAIKERVKRLLNAEVVDVTPLGLNLDEELGVASIDDAEFEEIGDPEDYEVGEE